LGGTLIVPPILADHLEAKFQGLGIDPDPFDRPVGGAHPETQISTLKGRTRGARTGEETLAISENDFSIRPNVQ
jgi:hypothetical protein